MSRATPRAEAPFGVHTEYLGPFYALHRDNVVPTWLVEADLWFPEGRRIGARAL